MTDTPSEAAARYAGTTDPNDVVMDLLRRYDFDKFETLALLERRRIGIERYGAPLKFDTPVDLEAYLVEELLDAVVYAHALHRADLVEKLLSVLGGDL